MLDFANGGISEVAGVTPAIPVAKPLPGDEILVSSDMRLGIRVDGAGMPMPCAPLSWTDNPSSVAFCHPYVLAVIEGQHIEVHSIASPGETPHVQTITFAHKGGLLVDGEIFNHALSGAAGGGAGGPFGVEGKGGGGGEKGGTSGVLLLAAATSGSTVYAIEPVPFREQVEDLIQSNAIEEAYTLLTQSMEGEPEAVREVEFRDFHIAAAKVAFEEVRIAEAFKHFAKAGTAAFDPREMLQFFPELVSTVSAAVRGEYRPRHLTPTMIFGNASASGDMTSAITALRERQARLSGDFASLQSDTAKVAEAVSQTRQQLMTYLEGVRADGSHQAGSAALEEMVDTALFRLLVQYRRSSQLNSMLAAEAKGKPNAKLAINLEAGVAVLEEAGQSDTLALLYQSRGRGRKALEVWRGLGNGDLKSSTSTCDGVKETVNFLKMHRDAEDIVLFAGWVQAMVHGSTGSGGGSGGIADRWWWRWKQQW